VQIPGDKKNRQGIEDGAKLPIGQMKRKARKLMTAVEEKVTFVEEDYDIVDTGHGNKPIIQTTIGMKNRTNNDMISNCDA